MEDRPINTGDVDLDIVLAENVEALKKEIKKAQRKACLRLVGENPSATGVCQGSCRIRLQ